LPLVLRHAVFGGDYTTIHKNDLNIGGIGSMLLYRLVDSGVTAHLENEKLGYRK
jgi:hypothetical protein